jgi:hypothetical protein
MLWGKTKSEIDCKPSCSPHSRKLQWMQPTPSAEDLNAVWCWHNLLGTVILAQSPEVGLSFCEFIQFLQTYGLIIHNDIFHIISAHNTQVSNFYGRFSSCGMCHCTLDYFCPKFRIPWPSKLLKYSLKTRRHIPDDCNLLKHRCDNLKCRSSFLIRHFVAT